MNDERGSWYLLTAVILGIGLGLLYSWVIDPAEYINTPPHSLRADFKDRYRAAIAVAFVATRDIQRAQARLALLGDADPALELVTQAQRYLATGDDYQAAQALADLASALGQAPTPLPNLPPQASAPSPTPVAPTDTPSSTPSASSTPSPTLGLTGTLTVTRPTRTLAVTLTPRPTASPTDTATPLPSQTPTPTLAPPFVLDNQILVCNPAIGEAQIQVFVSNAAGVGVSGVEIVVTWTDGEEHFFTGLKPEISAGYADFVMTPQVIYDLRVADGGQLIPGLTAPECTEGSDEPYWGSWRLIFSHP